MSGGFGSVEGVGTTGRKKFPTPTINHRDGGGVGGREDVGRRPRERGGGRLKEVTVRDDGRTEGSGGCQVKERGPRRGRRTTRGTMPCAREMTNVGAIHSRRRK